MKGTFREYIEGKNVAVVGRSPYLNTLQQGDKIDSFDVVVRLNSIIPYPLSGEAAEYVVDWESDSFVPDTFHNLIGTKTHVYYGHLRYYETLALDVTFKNFKRVGGEWAAQSHIWDVPLCVKEMDYIQRNFMPCHYTSMECYSELLRKTSYTKALYGTIAIYDLLYQCPKSLYFTGFSCYAEAGEEDRRHNEGFRPEKDFRLLHQLVAEYPQVSTDGVMMKMIWEQN